MAELNDGKVHISHFFEYSISASVMVIAICGQLGVTDLYLILNIALNCWSCMIMGAIAEVCFEHRKHLVFYFQFPTIFGLHRWNVHLFWVAHFSGWVVLLAGSMVGALSNVSMNEQCIGSDGTRIPQAILGLVYTEIVLFLLFGMVQLLWFRAKCKLDVDPAAITKGVDYALTTEASYITLSATAKIILGLGIFLSNLR